MSLVYTIGDTHFGHHNIAIKRGFKSSEEHDNHIINNWNKTCTKRDVIWLLGDITMEKSNYSILNQLNGIKKVILGNHDQGKHVKALLEYVNTVQSSYEKDNYILTHIPIHASEVDRFGFNIHAHTHENTIPDKRYICVSCEIIDYTPVLISNLLTIK